MFVLATVAITFTSTIDASPRLASPRLAAAAPRHPSAERDDGLISANPQVPHDVVIATLDAMRRTDSGDDLYPQVSFGVAR